MSAAVEESTFTKSHPIEAFILLAKNARGAAASQLVSQATEAPGMYVFGELAEVPGIKQLEQDSPKDWNLLQLFSFGTFQDYISNKGELPELNEKQILKLRHLTMASLASETKHVKYTTLQEQLQIENLRELEDLIIEAIYSGIIKAKLDQIENQLEIEYVMGRDIKAGALDSMIDILTDWCSNCEDALSSLETQIIRSNDCKELKTNLKKQTELEIESVKKAIKAQSQEMIQDDIEAATSSSSPALLTGSGKTPLKIKGFKGSLKASASTSRTR